MLLNNTDFNNFFKVDLYDAKKDIAVIRLDSKKRLSFIKKSIMQYAHKEAQKMKNDTYRNRLSEALKKAWKKYRKITLKKWFVQQNTNHNMNHCDINVIVEKSTEKALLLKGFFTNINLAINMWVPKSVIA